VAIAATESTPPIALQMQMQMLMLRPSGGDAGSGDRREEGTGT